MRPICAAWISASSVRLRAEGAGQGGINLAAIESNLILRTTAVVVRSFRQGQSSSAPCAALIGLDEDGIRNATRLAMLSAGFLSEIKYDPASPLRAVRKAFSARGAVEAALLAQAGAGAFAEPLEGRAGFFAIYGGGGMTEALTKDLSTRFLGD